MNMELQRVCCQFAFGSRVGERHQCAVDIILVYCLMMALLLVGPILSSKASICHVVGMDQRMCRKSSSTRHQHKERSNASERVLFSRGGPKGQCHVCEDVTGATCMTSGRHRLLGCDGARAKHQSCLVHCACLRQDICEA